MIELLNIHSFFNARHIESCTLLINQGYCNENYLLIADDSKYIVRKLLRTDIDRDFEWKVQLLAFDKNITAEPLVFDKANGFMVFEFLEGEHKSIVDKTDLKQLAQTLQTLHSITIDTKPITLEIKHQSIEVKKAFESIDTFKKEYVLCHNDLNPQNIFFSDDVKLIDWEYTGVNDRYFDLACVCVEFKCNDAQQEVFLNSYFKDESVVLEKLDAYKAIYRALCKEWFDSSKSLEH